MKDATKVNTIIGIGTKNHKFVDTNENIYILTLHLISSPIHGCATFISTKLSSASWFTLHNKRFNVQMLLKNHIIGTLINRQEAKLPIIYNSYVTSAQNKCHRPILISDMAFINLDFLGFFGYLITDIYIRGS